MSRSVCMHSQLLVDQVHASVGLPMQTLLTIKACFAHPAIAALAFLSHVVTVLHLSMPSRSHSARPHEWLQTQVRWNAFETSHRANGCKHNVEVEKQSSGGMRCTAITAEKRPMLLTAGGHAMLEA